MQESKIEFVERKVKEFGGDLSGIGKELRFAYFPTREQAEEFQAWTKGTELYTGISCRQGGIIGPSIEMNSYKVRVNFA